MSLRARWVAVLFALLTLPACLGDHRPRVVSPEPADDYVDQEAWASAQAEGTGDTVSSGFYGVGPSPSPDVHEPADARPGGHQPY